MVTKKIDFNSDLAQGFGVFKNEVEYELLDYISSVNISCGFHAGDPVTIKNALTACKDKNIAIGAHIGFCDLQGFGYRPMELDSDEIEAVVLYQIGAIASFAKTYNLNIEHVRPHGAMYKMAAENLDFSTAIANAIKKFDKWLVYYGAAGETLKKVSEETGIVVAHEIHVDKPYNENGIILWDEKEPVSIDASLNRIRTILHSSQMKTSSGFFAPVNCDTIHFNSKNQNSLELIKRASELITPTPCNYNKVEASGWV